MYDYGNYKDLLEVRKELNRREYEYDIAEAHLLLFMHDPEFFEKKIELKHVMLKCMGKLNMITRKVHYNFTEFETESQNDQKKRGEFFNKLTKQNRLDIDAYMKEIDFILPNFHSIHMWMIAKINEMLTALVG